MTLSGCKTLEATGNSAAELKAAASPAGECRRIARRVPDPGYQPDEDAIALIGRYQARLAVANKRLDAVAKCDDAAADRAAR